jgi:hypothetical protein
MVFTKDDVGIICEDEFAVEKYRGTLAYVERNNVA